MAQRWVECIEIVKSATVKTAFHSRLIAVFEIDYVLTKISAPEFVFDSIKMWWSAPHATIITKQYFVCFFWIMRWWQGYFMICGWRKFISGQHPNNAVDGVPWMPNKIIICHTLVSMMYSNMKSKTKIDSGTWKRNELCSMGKGFSCGILEILVSSKII